MGGRVPDSSRAEKLVATLKESGWAYLFFEGGWTVYAHPACQVEVPTPDGVRHWYDFPTYRPLRQVMFAFTVNKCIISVRTGTPWQGSTTRTVSLPKAITFIQEEFTP